MLVHLPYDHTLTLAGIEYARKSLHYTFDRMHLPAADRLRKIVAGVAVELAFQRWLDAQGVPFDRLGATPFTEKDRYDLRLGGRRCDVKSFLVSDKRKITALRRDPAWLLEAEALVPVDQFNSTRLGENDLYVFGFLSGLETRHSADIQKARHAGQPVHLLYTPAQPAWLGTDAWRSLGRLSLKSDSRQPLEMEIGGQTAGRQALSVRLRLEPRTRQEVEPEFFSWLYLHTADLPDGAIGVHSPALKRTALVAPTDWANIWVYGLDIIIAGWFTKADFRRRSVRLPRGSPARLYARTQTDNRAVKVRDLRPVSELVSRLKRAGLRR